MLRLDLTMQQLATKLCIVLNKYVYYINIRITVIKCRHWRITQKYKN